MEYKIGFALSGGAVRGMAHIGMLIAFEENGIRPDIIAGTSIGAAVGALYSYGISPEKMLAEFEKIRINKLLWDIAKNRAVSMHLLYELLHYFIREDDFDTLKIPLYINVTNLNNGKEVVIHSGKLIDYVVASCSIPIIVKPVIIDSVAYADGGIIRNMPSSLIRDKCELLIGNCLIPNDPVSNETLKSSFNLYMQTVQTMLRNNSRQDIRLCDLVLEPRNLFKYGNFNFAKTREIAEIGYNTAYEQMDRIKELVARVKEG